MTKKFYIYRFSRLLSNLSLQVNSIDNNLFRSEIDYCFAVKKYSISFTCYFISDKKLSTSTVFRYNENFRPFALVFKKEIEARYKKKGRNKYHTLQCTKKNCKIVFKNYAEDIIDKL